MVGAGATYAPQESIAGLIKVIEKLGPIDNGRFHDFKGNPIPWYWTPFRHRARPAKCWSIDALSRSAAFPPALHRQRHCHPEYSGTLAHIPITASSGAHTACPIRCSRHSTGSPRASSTAFASHPDVHDWIHLPVTCQDRQV
jgi:hypothetical protein